MNAFDYHGALVDRPETELVGHKHFNGLGSNGVHAMGRIALARLGCAALILCINAMTAWAQPKQVLLLYDERTDLPGLSMLDASITRELTAGGEDSIAIYREAMDLSRFNSESYLLHLRDHLRLKYAAKKIDVTVAAMKPALDFLLQYGDVLFPGAPIVFCGIDRRALAEEPLPAHVTGVILKRSFAPTLEVALRLHPGTRRVVVVGGNSAFDIAILGQAREEFRPYEDRVEFEYLTWLPLPDLLRRLSALPPGTLILYLGVFQDGSGESFVPHVVAQKISAAANRPVYGFVDQYLGRGIVGGYLYSMDTQGESVAKLVLRILAGTPAAELPMTEIESSHMMFDARQIARWGLDERLLPSGARVLFRDSSLWEDYRPHVIVAVAVLLLQALMIGGLMLQGKRRRRAERAAEQLRVELAHAGRLAAAGELIAAISHEINQPLAAMLVNLSTAEMLLPDDDPRLDHVRAILVDLRKDDERASEVVRRLRALLSRHEMAREPIDLNEAIGDILRLLEPESRRRQIDVVSIFDYSLPKILGDRVHLQQVVLNLVVNAMDAMESTPVDQRRVVVRTEQHDNGNIEVTVSDQGHGIAPQILSQLFQSFYTTKTRGMGLGLSIARSIVEAHGGRIWAECATGTGSTFRFSLPFVPRGTREATLPWR